MIWAIRGAAGGAPGGAPRAATVPAGASLSVAGLACIFQSLRDGRQHGARQILQGPASRTGAGFIRCVQEYRRAIIAASEQHRLRLQELGPVRVDDVLSVYPVPAPY